MELQKFFVEDEKIFASFLKLYSFLNHTVLQAVATDLSEFISFLPDVKCGGRGTQVCRCFSFYNFDFF